MLRIIATLPFGRGRYRTPRGKSIAEDPADAVDEALAGEPHARDVGRRLVVEEVLPEAERLHVQDADLEEEVGQRVRHRLPHLRLTDGGRDEHDAAARDLEGHR